MVEKIEFSVEEFLSKLEDLVEVTKKSIDGTKLLNRATRNQEGFSDEVYFFNVIYPDLKEIFYRIRAKGMIGKYIKD